MPLNRAAILGAVFVVAVAGSASAADEATCREQYNRSVGLCALEAGKTAREGDYSYYTTCGARFEPAYQKCLAGGNSSGQSTVGPPPDRCAAAKENIDWIFRDKGARNTFLNNRAQGKDAFDSAIAAQAHNPQAQRTLIDCRPWSINYVESLDPSRAPKLPKRQLSQPDCSCITIIPVGGLQYRVSNTCDAMHMLVRFVDALNSLRHSWADAGIVNGGGQSVVRAPAYDIVSISAANLKNAASSVTCIY